VDVLTRNRIGAAPVAGENGQLIGIISERDIICGLARFGEEVLALPVNRLMTRELATCSLGDSIVGLMEVMTNRRIRHFPVVADGRLCGIVSIGDLVKNRLDEVEFEANSLRSFIASA